MADEAKPGALALAMEKSPKDEPPAEPTQAEDLRDAGSAVMRAARRGDAELFTRALEAFLDLRGVK